MLASILLEPGSIENREIDTPRPGPDDLVLKVESVLTCGTDLKAYRRGHPLMPMPTVFGHEYAGIITDVGSSVKTFKPGDSVMAVHTAPCGSCRYCNHALENLCPALMDTKVLGAYAEFIRIPAPVINHNMYTKPEDLSFKEAAMLEPLACVAYGLSQVKINNTDTALIIGAGAIGLLHLLVLKGMGVHKVIMSGHRSYRLNLAKKLGADLVIDSLAEDPIEAVRDYTDGFGAPLVIECTGQPAVWEQSVELVSRGGNVILFGGCPGGTKVTFDTARLHYDQISLKGVFHFTPAAVKTAYELLAEQKIDVAPLITEERKLSDVPEVFQDLLTKDCIKYAIIPDARG